MRKLGNMYPKRGDRVWSPAEANSRVRRLRNGVEDGKGVKKEARLLFERWRWWML